MSKHTPGPWGIRGPAVDPPGLERAPEYIITPPDFGEHERTPLVAFVDDEADARLIAAAPDLLAACIEAEKMYREIQPAGGWQHVHDSLRAALAQATGDGA